MHRYAVSLFLTLSIPATADTRLSLTEAAKLAVAQSLTIRAADARLTESNAKARGASSFASPLFTIAQPFGTNTGGLDENLLITQTFELGKKRSSRVQTATAEREAVRADLLVTQREVMLRASTAFIEAMRSDSDLNLAKDALKLARDFSEAADKQFQAGEVARSQVVRIRIELSRAEQAFRSAENERANRFAALKSIVGLPDNENLQLTGDFSVPSTSVTVEQQFKRALSTRPEIVSARQVRNSKEAALRSAGAQSTPDFVIEARRASVDPAVNGQSIRLGLTFPILDFGRTRSEVQAARAVMNEQDHVIAELERTIKLEVSVARRNLDLAEKTVKSFESDRLARSRELMEMVKIGYDRGAISYLELLDAQHIYRQEQADFTRAQADLAIARLALRHAVGDPLP